MRAEDKEAIAAFHWRGAPDEAVAEAAVREIAARAQEEGFAVHWGRKVLEVRPPVEFDKGLGIKGLLRSEDVSAAIYVGDDTTDLDAFRALRALRAAGDLQCALCVAVSSDETPPELAARGGPLGGRSRGRARTAGGAALAPCVSSTSSGRRSCSVQERPRRSARSAFWPGRPTPTAWS